MYGTFNVKPHKEKKRPYLYLYFFLYVIQMNLSFSSSGIRTLIKGFRAMPRDFPNMMQRHCQNYSKCFLTSKIPTTSIHVLCQNMDIRPHQRSDRTQSSTSIFKKLRKNAQKNAISQARIGIF